jgi:hypothetical protein
MRGLQSSFRDNAINFVLVHVFQKKIKIFYESPIEQGIHAAELAYKNIWYQ